MDASDGGNARVRRVALALAVAALAVTGCGGSDPPTSGPEGSGTPHRDGSDRESERRASDRLVAARCPESAGNCRAATGRVLYVESVDPDGDGDLHVVLLGGGLSAPGVTVLDISRGLRPARDPSLGDLVTGAGPVYRGSYGQRQIQVNAFRVAP